MEMGILEGEELEVIGFAPLSTREETREAVAAARAAAPAWRDTPAPLRGRVLAKAALLMEQRKDELARLMCQVNGVNTQIVCSDFFHAPPEMLGAYDVVASFGVVEHFTDTETVIEGRVCGKHSGEFLGFAPTQREVELPFVAFYRFAASGKLTSERVVMNVGPLHG